jgi:hypothetical protein
MFIAFSRKKIASLIATPWLPESGRAEGGQD